MPLSLALTVVLAAAPVDSPSAVGDAGSAEPGSRAPLTVSTDLVDLRATEAGLRARVGDSLDSWRIRVGPAPAAGSVRVTVDGPDGSVRERTIALEGTTREDRSRELAASLALLIDQPGDPPKPRSDSQPEPTSPEPPPPEPEDHPTPARPAVRGWIGLGPRIEAGSGLRFEAGLDLLGGVWLVRDHVQPLGSLGVSGGRAAKIGVAHLRFGAGAAFGAPLPARPLWLGGYVLAHALWLRAKQAGVDTAWLSSTELGALLQYRGDRFYLGARTGLDLTVPPAAVRGKHGPVRRGVPRWVLGLSFGLLFG